MSLIILLFNCVVVKQDNNLLHICWLVHCVVQARFCDMQLLQNPLLCSSTELVSCWTLQRKSHLCIPFLGTAQPRSQFPQSTFMCLWAIYIFQGLVHIFSCSRIGRPWSWKYINLAQIYKCMNWEAEHYNSVLEITVSFLGCINGNQTLMLDSLRPFLCSEIISYKCFSRIWCWCLRMWARQFGRWEPFLHIQ